MRSYSRSPLSLLPLLLALSSGVQMHAQDGTWSSNGNGNWSDTTKWNGGIVADGADSTANFTLEFTGNRTITVDTARTIGGIVYSDTTPDRDLTISGGNTLTLDVTTGSPIINVTGRQVTINSVIGGSDGFTKAGDGKLVLTATQTYTGNTIISGGTVRFGSGWNNTWSGKSLSATSNLEINNGIVEAYYYLTRDLGTADGQIQITGGRSGFSNMQGDATGGGFVKFTDANTQVTWGSATFNPSTLVLNDAGASTTLRMQNPFDLNGANRTVEVSATGQGADRGTYATLEGVLSGSGGALTKTGVGTLMLNAANTYDGGTVINQGSLWFDRTAAMPTTGNVTVNDGGMLSVSVGGSGEWSTATSGAGSIGGLLAGDGGQSASQVSYSGNVSIGLNLNGSHTYSGVIADVAGSTSTGLHVGNKDGGAGSDPFKNTGVLTLDNANTYTGETHVNRNNTLILANANAIANSSGLFLNGAGSVQLTTAVSVKNLTIDSGANHTAVSGGTLAFQAGGTIKDMYNSYDSTITSAITGNPDVYINRGPTGNQYKGIIFAPDTGSQSLGVIYNPSAIGGSNDKGGVTLGGSTTGNTVESITYEAGYRYGTVYKTGSGEWTTGNIRTGTMRLQEGTLVVNGTITTDYSGFFMTGGKLSGNATVYRDDKRSANTITSGSILAPGNSVGTITFDWGTVGGPNGTQWTTTLQAGSIYEWEVGAGNATDVIHVEDGRFVAEGFTLSIQDLGGTPDASDQLTVFTYGTLDSKSLSLGSVVFDTSSLDTDFWSFSNLALTDDDAGTVYLTGLQYIPEPSATVLGLLGALGLLIRRRRH